MPTTNLTPTQLRKMAGRWLGGLSRWPRIYRDGGRRRHRAFPYCLTGGARKMPKAAMSGQRSPIGRPAPILPSRKFHSRFNSPGNGMTPGRCIFICAACWIMQRLSRRIVSAHMRIPMLVPASPWINSTVLPPAKLSVYVQGKIRPCRMAGQPWAEWLVGGCCKPAPTALWATQIVPGATDGYLSSTTPAPDAVAPARRGPAGKFK